MFDNLCETGGKTLYHFSYIALYMLFIIAHMLSYFKGFHSTIILLVEMLITKLRIRGDASWNLVNFLINL